jgi:hypothetical protein
MLYRVELIISVPDGVTVCQLEDELFSKIEQIDDTELEEVISIDEI